MWKVTRIASMTHLMGHRIVPTMSMSESQPFLWLCAVAGEAKKSKNGEPVRDPIGDTKPKLEIE